ncbi:MAG: FG-GAP repeat protein, partial [Planctomycetota bacterium]
MVGAPHYDDPTAGADAGAAWVYQRAGETWVRQVQLSPDDLSAGDSFGWSVAISGDTVVVGSPDWGDETDSDRGTAYVFVRSGTTWSQQQRLDGGTDWGYGLGYSVAVDGDVIAASENHGDAYVYERDDVVWSLAESLDNRLISVAVSGDIVATGAHYGVVSIYRRVTADWPSSSTLWSLEDRIAPDPSGATVYLSQSLSLDGETLLIGSPRETVDGTSYAGAAYIYRRSSGSEWEQVTRLTAPSAEYYGQFGWSVSLDGGTAVVGQPFTHRTNSSISEEGSVFVYQDASGWSLVDTLPAGYDRSSDEFGFAVAHDGNQLLVGAPLSDEAGFSSGTVIAYDGVINDVDVEVVSATFPERETLQATIASS